MDFLKNWSELSLNKTFRLSNSRCVENIEQQKIKQFNEKSCCFTYEFLLAHFLSC